MKGATGDAQDLDYYPNIHTIFTNFLRQKNTKIPRPTLSKAQYWDIIKLLKYGELENKRETTLYITSFGPVHEPINQLALVSVASKKKEPVIESSGEMIEHDEEEFFINYGVEKYNLVFMN